MSGSDINYGKSEYGPRLDFKNRKCRDPFCAVIYYLHIAGVIAAVGYIFGSYADEIRKQIEDTGDQQIVDPDSLDWTGVYVMFCLYLSHLHPTIE